MKAKNKGGEPHAELHARLTAKGTPPDAKYLILREHGASQEEALCLILPDIERLMMARGLL